MRWISCSLSSFVGSAVVSIVVLACGSEPVESASAGGSSSGSTGDGTMSVGSVSASGVTDPTASDPSASDPSATDPTTSTTATDSDSETATTSTGTDTNADESSTTTEAASSSDGSSSGTTGPEAPAYGPCDFDSILPECPDGEQCAVLPSGHHWCAVACDEDPDPCADAPGGDAVVECSAFFDLCALDCADDATCPDGMECVVVDAEISRCGWPV